MSTDPFQLEVREALRSTGLPQHLTTTGPSPVRLGGEMLGVAEGRPVEVVADVSNLGESLLVNATVHAEAIGQCSRCLAPLEEALTVRVSDVFGLTPDFISRDSAAESDAADDDDFEPLFVQEDMVDITQLVLDEAGLSLPFNPVCEDYGRECDEDIPAPDGVSGEQEAPADPRWAGLAAFATADDSDDSADKSDGSNGSDRDDDVDGATNAEKDRA